MRAVARPRAAEVAVAVSGTAAVVGAGHARLHRSWRSALAEQHRHCRPLAARPSRMATMASTSPPLPPLQTALGPRPWMASLPQTICRRAGIRCRGPLAPHSTLTAADSRIHSLVPSPPLRVYNCQPVEHCPPCFPPLPRPCAGRKFSALAGRGLIIKKKRWGSGLLAGAPNWLSARRYSK